MTCGVNVGIRVAHAASPILASISPELLEGQNARR